MPPLKIDAFARRTTGIINVFQASFKKYSDSSSQLRIDYVSNNRNEVTEEKRYTDTAAATLVSKTVYGYDDAGKVTSITHKNASDVTVDSFSYVDDAARAQCVEKR